MEYSKLVAVTGLPGLFELINSKTDGAIVRSLADNSTRFVSSRIHNFSHLESIEVYTVRDNVNLVEVLNAMDKAGGNLPDEKDAAAIKKYFEKVYPDMDFERVYASDMKKMVKWFDILKKNNVEIVLSEQPEEEAEIVEEEVEVEEKPAKKTSTKKKEVSAEAAEETPKKTTRKKKAE
jgi:biotin synthase-related radical SAM superfamily protein